MTIHDGNQVTNRTVLFYYVLEHNDWGVLSVHVLTNTNLLQSQSQCYQQTTKKIRTMSVTGLSSYWDVVKRL